MNIQERIIEIKKSSQSVADINMGLVGLLCETMMETQNVRDLYFDDIKNFHEKFHRSYDGGPRKLDPAMQEFRTRFLKEELDEYKEAVRFGDLEKQFDALIDLVYVAVGTAYLSGFPFRKGWHRVHTANMAKVEATSAEQSTRGYAGDIIKPKGWKPPYLTDLIADL